MRRKLKLGQIKIVKQTLTRINFFYEESHIEILKGTQTQTKPRQRRTYAYKDELVFVTALLHKSAPEGIHYLNPS